MLSLCRLTLTAAICWQLAGCAAPTLPTPPPTAEVALIGDEAVVTGLADPNSLVACVNEDTDRGVIEATDDMGAFVIRIGAQEGDRLTLWQLEGTAPGQILDLIVPAPAP